LAIGIDARLINGNRRGMGNVLYNILKRLKVYYNGKIYLFFDKNVEKQLYTELSNLGYEIIVLENSNYIWWEQVLFRLNIPNDVEIVWFPFNTGTIFLRKVKKILTLHDVMFMKSHKVLPYPKNMYQLLGRMYRKLIAPIIANQSDKIITISEAAKQDILIEIPKLMNNKIDVVYNGCSKDPKNLKLTEWQDFKHKNQIADEFILCLGASDPRKNTLYTIEVFNAFIRKNSLTNLQLVVCGVANWAESIYYKKVKELGIESQVRFLDYVPVEYLDLLYSKAKIFLFLSYYEGFGLPILESMAFGTPVVTTDVTSMPEIAGDAAIKTSYKDLDTTVKDIEKVYFNEELYNELINKGKERVKLFTWESTAKQIAQILDEVRNN
jgi:glycosyltransferase involved in cell wall biosynthesis